MALNITDTSYSGKVMAAFIVRSLFGCDTVQKGIVFVKDNIKKKFTIPRIQVENIVQARAATPATQGNINVDGKTLEPKDYMIYIEFNPRDFEDHWFAEDLDAKLLDRALPVTVESALIQEVLKTHDQFHEMAIWNSVEGSATPYTYYDGLIEKLDNDLGTIKVALPVALTEANIIAKLQAVKKAVPKALKRNPKLKYIMSHEDFEKYENALQALGQDNMNAVNAVKEQFSGRQIITLPGIPENTIIAAICSADMDSNLWIGLNSKDDENTVQLERLQANSEKWFLKMLLKVDVQVGFPEEVVMYRYVAA